MTLANGLSTRLAGCGAMAEARVRGRQRVATAAEIASAFSAWLTQALADNGSLP